MDPDATLDDLSAAMAAQDHARTAELAGALLDWLGRGGFAPSGYDEAETAGLITLLGTLRGVAAIRALTLT